MSHSNKTRDELKKELEESRNEVLRLKKILDEYNNEDIKHDKQEIKYENLLKIVPDTIYKINTDGYFTYISDAINQLGYEPDDLVGKHFSEIIHPDDLPFVSRSLILPRFRGKKTGYSDSPKLFDERRSGSRITRCLEARLLPKGWKKKKKTDIIFGSIFACGEIDSTGHYDKKGRDKSSRFLGTVGVIRDITDRKKFEENFQKVQRLKSLGILAGGIAHDFNNILTAIIGNITLIKFEIDPEENIYQAITDAEKASLRAKDLTNQLLTFAKGGTPIKNAASIVDLIRDISEFTLRGSNIKSRFNFPLDLWIVDIDEGQMSQVLNNLIINSTQSMPKGGYIDISAENIELSDDSREIQKGKYVKVSIRDYGTGIPKENIQKIFDPYFSTKEKGSGLGLTTSYSIIKSHGGHIYVESEIGKGTIFYILLPKSSSEIAEKEVIQIAGTRFKGHILLMDDDIDILKSTGNILDNFGFDVTIAQTGEEAIEIFERRAARCESFDVIIMDLTIPGGLGGKDTIKIIKEIDRNIKTIVSSGYSNDPIMSNYKDYGFDGVVAKPYNYEQLIHIINKVLDN